MITKHEIEIENTRCLGFSGSKRRTDIEEVDITKIRVYLHHMSLKNQ